MNRGMRKGWLVDLQFTGLVNTIKVMSSRSVYLTTILLRRLSFLIG